MQMCLRTQQFLVSCLVDSGRSFGEMVHLDSRASMLDWILELLISKVQQDHQAYKATSGSVKVLRLYRVLALGLFNSSHIVGSNLLLRPRILNIYIYCCINNCEQEI